jgi:hypothetical protein
LQEVERFSGFCPKQIGTDLLHQLLNTGRLVAILEDVWKQASQDLDLAGAAFSIIPGRRGRGLMLDNLLS